uniref:Tc1-like transposase DDE domain-containing protein n=1 Tax=Astyanax mexicanus TaxID=7994 RepID=A0A3B1K9S8_ASTMX
QFHDWTCCTGTSHRKENMKTVKHGAGSITAYGPGRLAFIDGSIHSKLYQRILKENIRTFVYDLDLRRRWVMHQDNDPEHTSRSANLNIVEWQIKSKSRPETNQKGP